MLLLPCFSRSQSAYFSNLRSELRSRPSIAATSVRGTPASAQLMTRMIVLARQGPRSLRPNENNQLACTRNADPQQTTTRLIMWGFRMLEQRATAKAFNNDRPVEFLSLRFM